MCFGLLFPQVAKKLLLVFYVFVILVAFFLVLLFYPCSLRCSNFLLAVVLAVELCRSVLSPTGFFAFVVYGVLSVMGLFGAFEKIFLRIFFFGQKSTLLQRGK